MEHVLWVEKYRPHNITDCVLSDTLKTMFLEIVKQEIVPNMIFAGKAGSGKTTVARALCDQLEIEYILINASKDGNIDTLRTQIQDFASTRSFSRKRKVVILDEADHLNANSTQPALRSFIEEAAVNVGFLFTCNTLSKIIPELHSRSSIIEFRIPNAERAGLQGQFFKRLKMILETEGVEYEPTPLKALIVKYWPDMRRTINELSRFALLGKIDESILNQVRDVPMSELIKSLKSHDFPAMRKWCAVHHDSDSVKIMRRIYDDLYATFEKGCIPGVVVLIGEYQFKAAFVQDQELNLVAFLTELMESADFV